MEQQKVSLVPLVALRKDLTGVNDPSPSPNPNPNPSFKPNHIPNPNPNFNPKTLTLTLRSS